MMNEILAIVGTVISLSSLVIAIVQTVRLTRLRSLRVNSLRAALQNCRIAMLESDRLLNDRKEYSIEDCGALIKIEAIHANSCATIRSILYELSQIDIPYDKRKLEKYISAGLITSKWLWTQATLFMKNPPKQSEMPDLPDDTPDLMYKAGRPDLGDEE